MRDLLIDESKILSTVRDGLSVIADASYKTHQHQCHHCGLPIRYPIIARRQDIDDFKTLMDSAYRVMNKYNITANLLAEIIADCHIAIAKKDSRHE